MDLNDFIDESIESIKNIKKLSETCCVEESILKSHSAYIDYLYNIKKINEVFNLSKHYIEFLKKEINESICHFPYRDNLLNLPISESQKQDYKKTIEDKLKDFSTILEGLLFNINFYKNLNFCSNNIVIIGSNGSGKTTLIDLLKQYLPKLGVVIPAQKVLIMPKFNAISDHNTSQKNLSVSQIKNKGSKITYDDTGHGIPHHIFNEIAGEFNLLLKSLFSERNAYANCYLSESQSSKDNVKPKVTTLDKVIKFWNKLIIDRELYIDKNAVLKVKDGSDSYEAFKMSDGERALLYYLGSVLKSSENGFIIVDEPEMHLHKTVVNKLWDLLESERSDCIFVYLTHDLDFATCRTSSKKTWIKSFVYPNKWDVQAIPENEIPEALLMEILGSRKKILFCEGDIGSIDHKIYNILFDDFIIKPVGGCSSVISYTRSFNAISEKNVSAYGLIDSDFNDFILLDKYKADNIYSLGVAEIENLFFDRDFIKLLSEYVKVGEQSNVVDSITNDIIKNFKKDYEAQACNYVSQYVDNFFTNSNFKKSSSRDELRKNFEKFIQSIDLNALYDSRSCKLKDIIESENYSEIIKVYNNKGLKRFGNDHLKITNFTERSIQLLEECETARSIILKYLPDELLEC